MSSSVTMKDVAKEAGVSLATVSKVVNGDKTVALENSQKVWDAVTKLGYKTNYAAKLLKTSRSRQISVILPSVTDPNFSGIFTGIERVLYENDYAASLCVTSEMRARENYFLEQALQQRVAGVVLITCQPDVKNERIKNLLESDVRVVFLEREPVTAGHAFLEYDNRRAIADCVQQLLEQGLRRFLLVTGPAEYSSERQAELGFRQALDSAFGCVGVESAVLESNFDKESVFAATVRHINHDFVPEVILTTGIPMYQGALKAADILRHRLANKVKFVTLGDFSWAQIYSDQHMIIGRNSLGMGEAAAEAVLAAVDDPTAHNGAYRLLESVLPEAEPPASASRRFVRTKGPGSRALRVLLHDSTSMRATRELLSDFEAQSGVRVEIDAMDYVCLYETICDPARRGSYDVVQVDQPWMGELCDAGMFEKLDRLLADRSDMTRTFIDGVMDAYCRHNGSYYALPYRLDTQLLFYRRDLFEERDIRQAYAKFSGGGELGPPKTWVEFNSIARFFTRSNNPASPTLYGTALGGQKPHGAFCEFLPRLWAYGGKMFDERGRVALDSRNSVEALANYCESFSYASLDAPDHWWREQVALFSSGQVAMTTLFSAPAASLADRAVSKVVGKIGFALMPGGVPLLGGWSLAVVAGTPRLESAFDWICWAVGDDLAMPHSVLGGATAAMNLYRSSELLSIYPWLPKTLESFGISRRRNIPYAHGRLQERDLENALGSAVHQAVTGELNPAEAIGAAARKMREIIA